MKGFEVIGALVVGTGSSNFEGIASEVLDVVRKLRTTLSGNFGGNSFENRDLVGAVVDPSTGDVQFFVSRSGNSSRLVSVNSTVYEDQPEKYVWERGCLLKCELPIRLPVYYPANSPKDSEDMFKRATEAVVAKFGDPKVTYILETLKESSIEAPQPVILRGIDLDLQAELSTMKLQDETPRESDAKSLLCSYFCLRDKDRTSVISVEI